MVMTDAQALHPGSVDVLSLLAIHDRREEAKSEQDEGVLLKAVELRNQFTEDTEHYQMNDGKSTQGSGHHEKEWFTGRPLENDGKGA